MLHLPKIISDELERLALPWRVEHGGKHFKLYVADKLAGTVSLDKDDRSRATLNVRAQVRRLAKTGGGGVIGGNSSYKPAGRPERFPDLAGLSPAAAGRGEENPQGKFRMGAQLGRCL